MLPLLAVQLTLLLLLLPRCCAEDLWNHPNIVLDSGDWHKIRTPFFGANDPRCDSARVCLALAHRCIALQRSGLIRHRTMRCRTIKRASSF